MYFIFSYLSNRHDDCKHNGSKFGYGGEYE